MTQQTPSSDPQPPQPQESFGEAPGGSSTFGSATPAPPGAPPAGPPPPGASPTGPPTEEPAPKKRNPLPAILISVGVIAALAVGGWFFTRGGAADAQVGQCLAGTTPEELDPNKLKIVDCTAADANFRVVERIEGKTRAESTTACTNESTQWSFWSGRDEARPGTVLCLVPAK